MTRFAKECGRLWHRFQCTERMTRMGEFISCVHRTVNHSKFPIYKYFHWARQIPLNGFGVSVQCSTCVCIEIYALLNKLRWLIKLVLHTSVFISLVIYIIDPYLSNRFRIDQKKCGVCARWCLECICHSPYNGSNASYQLKFSMSWRCPLVIHKLTISSSCLKLSPPPEEYARNANQKAPKNKSQTEYFSIKCNNFIKLNCFSAAISWSGVCFKLNTRTLLIIVARNSDQSMDVVSKFKNRLSFSFILKMVKDLCLFVCCELFTTHLLHIPSISLEPNMYCVVRVPSFGKCVIIRVIFKQLTDLFGRIRSKIAPGMIS